MTAVAFRFYGSIAAYMLLCLLGLFLAMDAACSLTARIEESSITARERLQEVREREERPCLTRGGVPIRSSWDGRLIDCKGIE